MNGNGTAALWKFTTGILASILLTGIVAWVTMARNTVSRDELAAVQADMLRDREAVRRDIGEINKTVGQINMNLAGWLKVQEYEGTRRR